MLVLVPLGVSTLALIVGVALLILSLPTDTHATNLLRTAALLWAFNILVFALWYWEVDGGGPWKRHLAGHRAADFLFPQQATGEHWAPHFLDYLFVAFTGATALSPADTYPLTRLSKMLMMTSSSSAMCSHPGWLGTPAAQEYRPGTISRALRPAPSESPDHPVARRDPPAKS